MRRKKKLYIVLALAVLLCACGKEDSTGRGRLKDAPAARETASEPVEEREKLSYEEIAALAEHCSLNVYWHTTEGDYAAGTSFLIDSDVFGQKLLVTAFHYLVPDDAQRFTGMDLPEYVQGGEIYDAKSGEDTHARPKNCLIIRDADAVPNIQKDVAAFTVENGDAIQTLALSQRQSVDRGEKLYLLAYLWDTDEKHEDIVYECEAVSMKDGVLTFKIDPQYGLMGASGGPIVDQYGEVIAMVMSGDARYNYGHTAESFEKQIAAATISEIEY